MKKIISSVLILRLIFTGIMFGETSAVYASEDPLRSDISKEVDTMSQSYLVVNGTQIVYQGEDYDNEETGEYIHWLDTRGTDKVFTFKIRHSVTSESFTINGTSVTVTASAILTDSADDPIDCDSFKKGNSVRFEERGILYGNNINR